MTKTLLLGGDRCKYMCVERSDSAPALEAEQGQGSEGGNFTLCVWERRAVARGAWLSLLPLLVAWQCMHTYAPAPILTSAPWKTQGGRGLCSLELPVIRRLPATARAGLAGFRISFAGYANRVPSSWGGRGTQGPGRQSGL